MQLTFSVYGRHLFSLYKGVISSLPVYGCYWFSLYTGGMWITSVYMCHFHSSCIRVGFVFLLYTCVTPSCIDVSLVLPVYMCHHPFLYTCVIGSACIDVSCVNLSLVYTRHCQVFSVYKGGITLPSIHPSPVYLPSCIRVGSLRLSYKVP